MIKLKQTFTLLGVFFMFFSSQQPTQVITQTNPLPDCPDSPNCAVATLTFEADSATVLNAADTVLRDMDAHSIEWNTESNQLNAVFKIPVFGFLDDFDLAVRTSGSETLLFIRSASREGYYDLGVNKRRVKKFTKHIKKQISN
jgi:uncharacterized protein (DUF1499 family)